MNAATFQRASSIFLEVRRAPAESQSALLKDRCGDDLELRRAVEELLEHDARVEQADGAFRTLGVDQAIRRAAAEVLAGPAPARGNVEGRRIGAYRLVRVLGEGGMGTVYEAEQDHPRRTVALKIVRAGIVSPSLLRRFEHEAQVLGRLQHSGIAQIYDAGTNDAGEGAQPYFAMEYIDGPPLDDFARRHALGVRQRLELLARVCDAVEHAHQKGVIHRDLKPANILVDARDPSAAQPKVLDFGVARAIDSDVQSTTLRTGVGELIGTIAYMSPEQMSGDSSQIDTRSDVYALGVIGYELLSGAPPIDVRGKTVPEAVRAIGENDPSPLGSVNRIFRGDVETIIAKAIDKDKSRRYQSAADLAADIRRSLRDEPILATPASTMDQLRKFARRNKALVGGLVAVVVVLVAGVVGTSVGMARAAEEARAAKSEARKSDRMNEYLKGMIAFLVPSGTRSHEVTLRQVLDDASRRLDAEFADEPEIAAELLLTIARGYDQLGVYEVSAAHAKRAIDLIEPFADERDPRLIRALEVYAAACFRAEKFPQAEQAFKRVLASYRSRPGDDDSGVLSTIRYLVHLLRVQGKESEVTPLMTEVMDVARRLPTEPSNATAENLHAVGDILGMQHQVAEAESMYRRSIDMYRRLQPDGPNRRDYMFMLRDFAMLLSFNQRWSEAEALDREAVELCRQSYGEEHEQTLMTMRGLLGRLRAQQKFEEAEPLARSLLTLNRKLYGDEHAGTAGAALNLATVLRARRDFHPALELFRQAVQLRRTLEPRDEAELARSLGGEGATLLDLRRADEAEAPLRECLALRERMVAANHPSVTLVRSQLGAALVEQGRYAEAEPLLVSSWEALRHVPTIEPQIQHDCLTRLVTLYDRWQRPEQAHAYRMQLPGP